MNNLEYSFDRELVEKELENLLINIETIDYEASNKLLYFVRKFELNCEYLNSIFKGDFIQKILKGLSENNSSQQTVYVLSLILKFLVHYSKSATDIKQSDIIDIIKLSTNDQVKSELILIHENLIKNSNEMFNSSTIEAVQNLNINMSSKKLSYETEHCLLGDKIVGKKNKLIVSKSKQIDKTFITVIKVKDYDPKLIGLTFELENRMSKISVITDIKEQYIEEPNVATDEIGSDQSIIRNNWDECFNFYRLAFNGKIIKKKDQDYLGDLFLRKVENYFFPLPILDSSTKLFKAFFINRMVSAIFLKISKNYKLDEKIIEKLMKCVADLKKIIKNELQLIKDEFELIYSDTHVQILCKLIVKEVINQKESKTSDLIEKFASDVIKKVPSKKELKAKSYNEEEVFEILKLEIQQLRLDACNALYNAAIRDRSILTNNRIFKINNCFLNLSDSRDNDEQFKNILSKLLNLNKANIDYKKLFLAHLETLKLPKSSMENLKNAIEFINDQSKDFKRCEEIFNKNVIEQLVGFMANLKSNDSNMKILILDTINNYLQGKLKQKSERTICSFKEKCDISLDKFRCGSCRLFNICTVCAYKCHKDHDLVYLNNNKYLCACKIEYCSAMMQVGDEIQDENWKIKFSNIYIQGLNEEQMSIIIEDLIENADISSDSELIQNAFMTILLTIKVNMKLSETIATKLLKNLENYPNHIILILSQSKLVCIEQERDIELLSEYLDSKNAFVLSSEFSEFKFEPYSNCDNSNSIPISLFCSQIIFSFVKYNRLVASKTVINLLNSIDHSIDENTKIYSAKCLHEVSRNYEFDSKTLIDMLKHIKSEIYDISACIHSAYINGLCTMARGISPIDRILLESLSSLIILHSELIVDGENIADMVNINILSILQSEATKQKFEDENLFYQLEEILSLRKEEYTKEVLGILEEYAKVREGRISYDIPLNTIKEVESTFFYTDFSHEALCVLKNVIHNGQPVSNAVLKIFVDNLYVSDDPNQRLDSFHLLNKAMKHQLIQDDIFFIIELQRAAYHLNFSSKTVNCNSVFNFILKQTNEGKLLPIDTMNAICMEILEHDEVLNEENEVSSLKFDRDSWNKEILKILVDATKNKQILNVSILNKLESILESSDNLNELICIFKNTLANNQTLPKSLIEKLETFFYHEPIEKKILQIFFLIGEREELSSSVINSIIEKIENESEDYFKQKWLNSLASIIQNNKEHVNFYKKKIENLLNEGLNSKNINIQNVCINVWKELIRVVSMEWNYMDKMIEICTSIDTEHSVMQNVFELLNREELEEKAKTKINLANLSFNSSDELLDKLEQHADKESGLLEQNFKQLAYIINKESSNLQMRALRLLLSTISKAKVTSDLIQSIKMLFERTNLDEIKNICLEIVKKFISIDESLEDEFKNILIHETKHFTKEFMKSGLYKAIKMSSQLDDSKLEDLAKFFKSISVHILDVLEANEIFSVILQIDCDFYENVAFVKFIETILQTYSDEISENALLCYNRIIKEKKCRNLKLTLQKQVEFYMTSSNKEISPILIECIYNAIQLSENNSNELLVLENNCYELLEANVINTNETIRGFSFKSFKLAAHMRNYKSEIFKKLCDTHMEYLCDKLGIKFTGDYFIDLLEIMFSLKYADLDIFKLKEPNLWKSELIISNIFKCLEAQDHQKIEFYTNWLQVEEKFEKSIDILILLSRRISSFQSMDEINECFSFIQNSSFVDIISNLNNYENSFENLKILWCLEMINSRLVDKSIKKEYLKKTARTLARLKTNFIKKMFNCVSKIDDITYFESTIKFFSEFHDRIVNDDDFPLQETTLDCFRKLIEANLIYYEIELKTKCKKNWHLFNILVDLLSRTWKFENLKEFVEKHLYIDQSCNNTFQCILQLLCIVMNYKLTPVILQDQCNNFLSMSSETNLIRLISKLAVENTSTDKKKSPSELLSEIQKINSGNPKLLAYVQTKLRTDFEGVKSKALTSKFFTCYPICKSSRTSICKNCRPICEWEKANIENWSERIRSEELELDVVEILAVVKRANFLFFEFNLSDVQIICSLIALNFEKLEPNSCLFQVATGEGKSTIVCILAIINALKGKKVNIITSTPVLAERDAIGKKKLYEIFGLKCSCNAEKVPYAKGTKHCYNADIVYGEMAQFQFDQLRDNYSRLETLGGRSCEIVIIDEVDSMLIDDNSKIARLSSTIPGMDTFQFIFVALWYKLTSIEEQLFVYKGKTYLLKAKKRLEKGKFELEFAKQNGELAKIHDLEEHFDRNKEIKTFAQTIGDIEQYLKSTLNEYLDSLIKDKRIIIPMNFEEYFEKKKSKWIINAIDALNYHENIHYVVQDGQIKPVDYQSTGIIQDGTSWSDGLHRYLEIKHNLKMNCETFTTNFLSNIAFIKAHKTVFGLTATLGSEATRDLLKMIYNVDLVNIPQQHVKQFIEYKPIMCQSEVEWINEICIASEFETKKRCRGVLIICATIAQATMIGNMLKSKSKYRSGMIKLYTMNNQNQEKQIEKIFPGEIIIATNLAGRGTDIDADEIEESGGLHVILTYMPYSCRIEEQAFGRTSRQGKRGTGQMILKSNTSYSSSNVDFKKERDDCEKKQLQEFIDKDLDSILKKDEFFKEFCNFLNNEMRDAIRQKRPFSIDNLKEIFTVMKPATYELNILTAIEEQWAIFLLKLDDKIISLENSELEFYKFIKDIRKNFSENKLIKNPYYNIVIGYSLIVDSYMSSSNITKNSKINPLKILNSDFEKARDHLEDAIKLYENLDQYYYGAAHVGLVWHEILLKNRMVERMKRCISEKLGKKDKSNAQDVTVPIMNSLENDNEKSNQTQKSFKMNLCASLNRALISLSSELSYLNSIQIVLRASKKDFTNSDLDKQLILKSTILSLYLNNVKSCNSDIKKSMRLIDVVEKVDKTGELLFGLERDEKTREIIFDWKETAEYDLTFNNLTTREDSGTIDQALNTIENIFKSINGLRPSYDNISIRLNHIQIDTLKCLLNREKNLYKIPKELAITKLKSEKDFLQTLRLKKSHLVDLTMIDQTNEIKLSENKQINQIIQLIECMSCTDRLFSIKIKDANLNRIHEILEENPNIEIHFHELDFDSASEHLKLYKSIEDEETLKINIEIVLNGNQLFDYLNAFKSDRNFLVKIFNINSNKFEVLDREELLEKKSKYEHKDMITNFLNKNLSETNSFLEFFKNSIFNITINIFKFLTFKSIYLTENNLEIMDVDFSINQLKKSDAEIFIEVLRKNNLNFCLEFRNLKKLESEFVIKNADLNQENLEITKVRNLKEFFASDTLTKNELAEFAARGIEYLIEINEKGFVPWRSIIIVASLATLQIIVGGILMAIGVSSRIGMGFLVGGINDYLKALTAYNSRKFNWTAYTKKKAFSIVTSLIIAGASNIEIVKELTATVKNTMEQVTENQIYGYVKKVTRKVSITGVKLALKMGTEYASKVSYDLLRTKVHDYIEEEVTKVFSEINLNKLFHTIFTEASSTDSNSLLEEINKTASKIVNLSIAFLSSKFDSIGRRLLQTIVLSSKEKKRNSVLNIAAILESFDEILLLLNKIHDEITLAVKDETEMTMEFILKRHLKIDEEMAKHVSSKLKDFFIIDESNNLIVNHDLEISTRIENCFKTSEEAKFKQFIEIYYDTYVTTRCVIIKTISNKIADQLTVLSESSQMLQQLSSQVVKNLTDDFMVEIKSFHNDDMSVEKNYERIMDDSYHQEKNHTNILDGLNEVSISSEAFRKDDVDSNCKILDDENHEKNSSKLLSDNDYSLFFNVFKKENKVQVIKVCSEIIITEGMSNINFIHDRISQLINRSFSNSNTNSEQLLKQIKSVIYVNKKQSDSIVLEFENANSQTKNGLLNRYKDWENQINCLNSFIKKDFDDLMVVATVLYRNTES